MHFHPKVILVPLLGLAHLRVSRPSPVLGGRRRFYDGGIHYGPFPQPQSPGLQITFDLLKQTLPQLMLLQDMTEVQYRALVWQRLRQPQSHEPPHRLRLVEQVLHPQDR